MKRCVFCDRFHLIREDSRSNQRKKITDTSGQGRSLQCFVGGKALLTNSDAADAIRLGYQVLSALLSARGGTRPDPGERRKSGLWRN